MKQITILLAIICCFIATSYGQGRHGGGGSLEDRIDHRLDKMDEVVKFTGNQRNDMKILLMDIAKRKKDAFCANEIGTTQMKKAMKDINKDRKKGVEKILNKDQMKLWKDFKKENKDGHKGKAHKLLKDQGNLDDRINDHLDKMNEVVKFTGTQREDMKALLTDIAKRKKDAFCANDLGSDNMKDAMKIIREDRKAGMKKILTEDQIKLWKDHLKAKKDQKKNKDIDPILNDDKKEK